MAYDPNFFGPVAKLPSAGSASEYINGTVSTIPIASPVSINSSGNLSLTDVSSEISVLSWVGITAENVSPSTSGQIASDGRIKKIPGSLNFGLGNPIWIGLNGILTNIKPDLTVSGWHHGYWVVFVGVVVINRDDNTAQDIQILKQIVGQL